MWRVIVREEGRMGGMEAWRDGDRENGWPEFVIAVDRW